MTTVVIGLGNRTLSDDAVGCVVAGKVSAALGASSGVACREVYTGGLDLMEAMAGFDRAILVDAIETGEVPAGTIVRVTEGSALQTRNTCSSHDGSLPTALALARQAGLKVPGEIRIWAIEARDVSTFSERLTEPVAAAAGVLASRIAGELNEVQA